MEQALVMVERRQAAETLARISGALRVLSVLPPRLAIVEAAADDLEHLRRQPGVEAVWTDVISDPSLAALDASELLFAEGWLMRRTPKTRLGQGQPWDAPGFEPPDGSRSPPKK